MICPDVLVRLLSIYLRRYTREPDERQIAARHLLFTAFILYSQITSEEDALDVVTSAHTISEAA